MIRRFDTPVIQAVNAAREEALRLSSVWVEPDHLLLGLLHETEGLPARVFRAVGLSYRQARACIPSRPVGAHQVMRHEDLVLGATTWSVLSFAEQRGEVRVTVAAVLSALLDLDIPSVRVVLAGLDVTADALRRAQVRLCARAGTGDTGSSSGVGHIPVAEPSLVAVLDRAGLIAGQHGYGAVDAGCLLVACLQDPLGEAQALLPSRLRELLVGEGLYVAGLGRGSGARDACVVWHPEMGDVLRVAGQLAKAQGLVAPGEAQVLAALLHLEPVAVRVILAKWGVSVAALRAQLPVAFVWESVAVGGDPAVSQMV